MDVVEGHSSKGVSQKSRYLKEVVSSSSLGSPLFTSLTNSGSLEQPLSAVDPCPASGPLFLAKLLEWQGALTHTETRSHIDLP